MPNAVFTPNPDAPAKEKRIALQIADEFAAWVRSDAKARVHKDTTLLAQSITSEPAEWDGVRAMAQTHDGPAARGETYGAVEEVVRGGPHKWLLPAVENVAAKGPEIARAAFGAGGGPGSAPSTAWD